MEAWNIIKTCPNFARQQEGDTYVHKADMSDGNPKTILVYKRLRKDHCYTMTGGGHHNISVEANKMLQKRAAAANVDQYGLQQRDSLQTCSQTSFS